MPDEMKSTARLGSTDGSEAWHELLINGLMVASVWGIPKVTSHNIGAPIMVTIKTPEGSPIAFYHCNEAIVNPIFVDNKATKEDTHQETPA